MSLAAQQWQGRLDLDRIPKSGPMRTYPPNRYTRTWSRGAAISNGRSIRPTSCWNQPPMRGELRVHLDTETPGFDTFLAEIDGGEASRVAAIFPWKLHAGHNRLKVWPRNNAGRDGIASWIDLEM